MRTLSDVEADLFRSLGNDDDVDLVQPDGYVETAAMMMMSAGTTIFLPLFSAAPS